MSLTLTLALLGGGALILLATLISALLLYRYASERARLEAELTHTQQRLEAQEEELVTRQEKLSAEFQNLANQILEEKTKKFTEQNQTQLNTLLQPLQERLKEYQQQIDLTRKQDIEDRATLIGEIKTLSELNQAMSEEAQQLTQALQGQSKVQGDWGEMILERILEHSGLQEKISYLSQPSYRDEKNQLKRPDLILQLPQGRQLIVDSKVSLTAYVNFTQSESADEQARYLKQHVESIKRHVNDLGKKNYSALPEINSLDFVLMFVPLEAALSTALKASPELYNEAFSKNIVLVTTTTLLATLKLVKNFWREEKQSRNAEEIARQGGLLYDRFVVLYEDLVRLGQQIQTAQTHCEGIIKRAGTGQGNLVSRAEKLKGLGASVSRALPTKLVKQALEEESANNTEESEASITQSEEEEDS